MLVAPHKGAWIEIVVNATMHKVTAVAPHKGAWIEIRYIGQCAKKSKVAPHKGAWIEISIRVAINDGIVCRSPQGSVD